MKMWILLGIIALTALFVVGGILITNNFVKADSNATKTTATTTPAFSCSSCQGKCTAQSNCGSATCGAVTGSKCGCSK